MKNILNTQIRGISCSVVLLTLWSAGGPAWAVDYYHLDTSVARSVLMERSDYSTGDDNTNAAAAGTINSFDDHLYFYNSAVTGPVNREFVLGSSGRNIGSMTFGANSGTTQIDRDAATNGTGNNTVLQVGAGGITMDAGAGAVSFGSSVADRNQRVVVGAFADMSIVNNSSSDLRFNRVFDGRTVGVTNVITVAGSGDGDTIFVEGIRDNTSGRGLAMTINKTSGTGVVRFEGSNNYTGATIVAAGTLRLTGNARLGTSEVNLGDTSGSMDAKLQINTGVTLDTTTGKTLVVRAGSTGTKTIESIATSGTATISLDVLLDGDLTALSTSGGTLSISSTSFDLKNQTLTVAGAGNTTISSALAQSTGAGKLVKSGNGTLTLSGANTYSGGTVLSAGTIRIGNASALSSGDLTLNGGTLASSAGTARTMTNNVALGGNITLGEATGGTGILTFSGPVSLGSATRTITVANTANTISGIISGTGGLTKDGTGQLTISGVNTYTGNTTVSAGTLLLGANNVIDNASAVVISGGTFNSANRTNTVASLTMSGGSLTMGSGTLAISGASTITAGMIAAQTGLSIIRFGGALTIGAVTATWTGTGNDASAVWTLSNNLTTTGSGSTVLSNISTNAGVPFLNLGGGVRSFDIIAGTVFDTAWALRTGGLIKLGAGTLILRGAASGNFTNTTLSNGVLLLGIDTALGTDASGLVTLAGGTISSLDSSSRSIANNISIVDDVTFGQTASGTGSLTFSSIATNNLGGGTNTLTTLVDTTIAGALGNGGITKAGAGTLYLSNASSSFGGLTINTGTVRFQTNAAINSLTGSSGTLDLAGGTLSVSDTAGTSTYSSTVTGSGNLTKAGNSVLVLSGNNTGYSGTTTLSAGTLRAGSDAAVGTGTLALNGGIFASGSSAARGLNNAVTIGGNVQFGDATGTGNLTLSNTVDLGAGNRTLTVLNDTLMRGVVSNGDLTKEGAGTLQLSNASTSFGALAVNAGQLALKTNAAVTQLAGSGGTLDLAGASTLTVTSTGVNNTISSAITGSGNLIKAGDGTLVLSGNNTYSGTTTISNGLVRMGSSGTAIAGNVTIAGGTLNYSSTTDNQIATNATVTITSGAFNLGARNQTVSAMTMSGGTLSRAGGTLTLGGPSSFTGGTVNVSAGGSQIATTGETTFGAVTFSNANTAGVTMVNALALGGDVVTTGSGTTVFASTNGTPQINLGGTRTFNIVSGTAMEVGWGLRAGGLTQTGDGRLDLLASAGGSMTAVTLSSGIMRVGVDDALGAASLALNSGTFASVSSAARTVTNALNIGGNVALGQTAGGTGALTFSNADLGGASRTLTLNQAVSFVGAVTNGSVVMQGGANLTFSNAGTSLGNLNITAGNAVFQANATVGGLAGSGGGALNLAAGILSVNASTNSSFGQVISGTGGLTKTGSGTLTLSANNTYEGATTVSGGRLVVTGTNTSSAITVTNTGTLSGTGVVGNVVVADGGRIAPGSSPGNLTVGNFTMGGGGGYEWEITNVTGTPGTEWDLITITGTTSITATSESRFTIFITGSSVTGWDADANDSWIIMDWSGGTAPGAFDPGVFTLNTASFGDTISGIFSLTADSDYLTLVYTATGTPTYDEASGVWSTGFTPGIVNNADAIFDGAGGTATNDIVAATFDTIGTITFATNATGSYTLVADSGSAGFDTNSALIIAGNIVNESGFAQTIDLALSASATKIVNAASNDLTLSGGIIGSGGTDKIGDNLLVLSGDNSYTGATTISNGTVRLGSATALGATNSGTTVLSGAVLDLNGQAVGHEAVSIAGTGISGGGALLNSSGSAASLSGALTLTANATVNHTGDLTLSSAVGGAFTLTKDGAGVLNFGASNTVTGMTINAGTVNFGANNALGTGILTMNGGTLANTNSSARTLSNNIVVGGDFGLSQSGTGAMTLTGNMDLTGGTRTLTLNRSATFGGVISNGGLTLATPGGLGRTLTLTQANTYTGATTINSGRLTLSGAGGVSSSTAVNVARTSGNAEFNIAGIDAASLTIGSLAAGNDPGATVDLGAKTLIAGGNNSNTTFGGVISNTGSFVKTGTGTMTFTHASTYTGSTTISNGEIALSGAGRFAADSALDLASSGAVLDLSGISGTGSDGRTNASLAGVAGSSVVLGAKNLTVGSSGTNTTFAGVISGSGGSLSKAGTGTMTLSGANTFTGGSTLSAGVLRAAHGSALGTGALVASEGTTLEITNGVTIANNMSVFTVKFLDGGNTLSGTITNNNTVYDVASGQTNTVSGFVTGAGGVELIGGGQLNLTGTTNNYTGNTVISNGTLQISTLANSNTVSSIGVSNNVTLAGANATNAVLDYTGGNVATDRTFVLNEGGGTITMASSSTEMTMTGSASGSGTLIVGEGTLVLSNTSTANAFAPGSIQVDSGATLKLAASDQIGNSTGLILNGGTFLVGASTLSDSLGTLTLSASSTIDFGDFGATGLRQITFADSSAITWTGTLTITNWQGVALTSSDFTQLVFGVGGLNNTQLGEIVFASQGINGGELIGGGELVPVPEPRVYAAAVALLAVVGWRERKRLLGLLSKGKKPKV